MPLPTPVALIVFNRPYETAVTFERIRAQQPRRLFVVADGPRTTDESARCEEVRRIVERVDWQCDVHREYADMNLGCKRRVSTGLDWVFSKTDRAIIIEDDCVPADDFFVLCENLLERYEHDERVAAITGDNFQDGIRRGEGSYYFSKYPHVWGWATWRRAWRRYDPDLGFWSVWKASSDWAQFHEAAEEREHWQRAFDAVASGAIDTWDYQWVASVWFHGGLVATPNANLVTNIGFGREATHTRSWTAAADRPTMALGPIRHPSRVEQDVEADRYTFDHVFNLATATGVRRYARALSRLAWRAPRPR